MFTGGKNQIGGQTYDNAGNLLSVNGLPLTYNAENQVTSVNNGVVRTYLYDGLGRRVQRSASGTAITYLYDAFGQLAEEVASGSGYITWWKDYVRLGTGGVVAMETPNSPCTPCYFSADHLGTTRMVMDAGANVVGRHDFLPFGEEIPANTDGRDGNFGTFNDNVAQKFTGQIRDDESGMDYFNARYYGGALGRFMSVDPHNAGARLTNPQSWNAYAYVLGNPLNSADPTGMDCFARSGGQHAHVADGGGSCDGYYGPPEYGGYSVDGSAPFAPGMFGSGAGGESAVTCPNNFCGGLASGPNGPTYLQYVADAGGQSGYTQQAIAQAFAGPNLAAIFKAFGAVAPYLGLDPNTIYNVIYQVRGTTYNLQIDYSQVDYSRSSAVYSYWDLNWGIMSQMSADPLRGFHSGNDSVYLGSQFTDVLHLVDVEYPYNAGDHTIQAGLDFHIDAFDPISGPLGFAAHFFTEVIPFFFNSAGASGSVSCALATGCH